MRMSPMSSVPPTSVSRQRDEVGRERPERGVAQHQRQPECSQYLRQHRAARDVLHESDVNQHAEHEEHQGRDRDGDRGAEVEQRVGEERNVHRQHDEVAVGEVDHVHHAPDQGEPRREQRIYRSHHQPADHDLQQYHASSRARPTHDAPRGGKRWLSSPQACCLKPMRVLSTTLLRTLGRLVSAMVVLAWIGSDLAEPVVTLPFGIRLQPIRDQGVAQARFYRGEPVMGPLGYATGPVSARDVLFARAMTIHHQGALAMAKDYPERDQGRSVLGARLGGHDAGCPRDADCDASAARRGGIAPAGAADAGDAGYAARPRHVTCSRVGRARNRT